MTKKNLDNQWIKYVSRRFTLFKLDLYLESLRKSLKINFGYDELEMLVVGKGLEIEWYMSSKFKKDFANIILDHTKNCLKKKKDPYKIFIDSSKEVLNTCKKINESNPETKEEILFAYKQFKDKFTNYQLVMWFPVICQETLFPYAKNRLKKYISKDLDVHWNNITTPFNPSIIQQENISLLKVAKKFSYKKLVKHYKNYSWMNMSFVDKSPHTLEYFEDRLKEYNNPKKELKKIYNNLENSKKRFFKSLKEINPSKEYRELFVFINKLNLLRQIKDAGRRRVYYYTKFLFEKIAYNLGLEFHELFSIPENEIITRLKTDKIYDQKKEYLVITKNGEKEIITSNIKSRLIKEGITIEKKIYTDIIKGNIANKGIVKGIIRHITINNWEQDIKNFKEGEILLSKSTKPDYIPAMKKAIAFITDEGGITSHAAIVSREMGKPCIVGTKNATRIFNNGELVEVNANSGEIKRIKIKK